MADDIDSLSEKEKATLRLIVRGHDAKSAARELALSVHTINERLRNARRKLAVTSSREAGRMLLASETATYENPAYNGLGEASAQEPGDHPATGPRRIGESPGSERNRAFLIAGVIAMILATLVTIALVGADQEPSDDIIVASTEPPAAAISGTDEGIELQTAAREWLALVDRSDWQKSHNIAGTVFRQSITVAGFEDAVRQARQPLGDVIEREFVSAEPVPGPPSGYILATFLTDFENRSSAVELVTLDREAGNWKVVGYFIG